MREFVIIFYDEYDVKIEAYGHETKGRRPTIEEVGALASNHENIARFRIFEVIYKPIKNLSRGKES